MKFKHSGCYFSSDLFHTFTSTPAFAELGLKPNWLVETNIFNDTIVAIGRNSPKLAIYNKNENEWNFLGWYYSTADLRSQNIICILNINSINLYYSIMTVIGFLLLRFHVEASSGYKEKK